MRKSNKKKSSDVLVHNCVKILSNNINRKGVVAFNIELANEIKKECEKEGIQVVIEGRLTHYLVKRL